MNSLVLFITVALLPWTNRKSGVATNICFSHDWLFLRGSIGDRWIPLIRGKWFRASMFVYCYPEEAGPLLRASFNFNPCMDTKSHAQWSVWWNHIYIYISPNFKGCTPCVPLGSENKQHLSVPYCRIWSWSPMPCEKHGPRELSRQKPRPKAEVFVVTEARGPCFSHGMGYHDQILL